MKCQSCGHPLRAQVDGARWIRTCVRCGSVEEAGFRAPDPSHYRFSSVRAALSFAAHAMGRSGRSPMDYEVRGDGTTTREEIVGDAALVLRCLDRLGVPLRKDTDDAQERADDARAVANIQVALGWAVYGRERFVGATREPFAAVVARRMGCSQQQAGGRIGYLLSEAAAALREAGMIPPLYRAQPDDPDRLEGWTAIAEYCRMSESGARRAADRGEITVLREGAKVFTTRALLDAERVALVR